MADDAAIRRCNLNRLLKARGWTANDLATRYYGRYTYWRDMLTEPNKSFGEKAARRIEDAIGLPRLWLDQPDADVQLAPSATHASEPAPVFEPPRWPWTRDLWKVVCIMDEEQLQHAEQVLRAHLGLAPL